MRPPRGEEAGLLLPTAAESASRNTRNTIIASLLMSAILVVGALVFKDSSRQSPVAAPLSNLKASSPMVLLQLEQDSLHRLVR